jgi:hypothetical protein
MMTIRCVLICDGAEISEGIATTKRDALADARSQLGEMDNAMCAALGCKAQYYVELSM